MVPALVSQDVPSKRPNDYSDAGNAKQRRHYHHKHEPKVRQAIDSEAAAIPQDGQIFDKQLERAIDLVLEVLGFSHAEPLALESFRALAEEYMARFLEDVRVSMTSARRTQPIPHDFLHALNKNHLTLRSLLPHLKSPIPATKTQPSLSAEKMSQETVVQEARLINQLLRQTTLDSQPHVPRNFPGLPSRHTFKSEDVFQNPEKDQKQIREEATQEARLGEEALRRLMSKKASGDNTLLTGLRAGSKQSLRQRSRALWRQTYEEALRHGKQRGDAMDVDNDESMSHLGPAVNADSIYWRKPIARKIAETDPMD